MKKFAAKNGDENSIKRGERGLGEGRVIKAHAFSLTGYAVPHWLSSFQAEGSLFLFSLGSAFFGQGMNSPSGLLILLNLGFCS